MFYIKIKYQFNVLMKNMEVKMKTCTAMLLFFSKWYKDV